jgi:geranylgeranyl reductase
MKTYDLVVVGGGPAGATAAHTAATAGLDVLLLDRGGRIKPCGGAVPPQLMKDFDVPDSVLVNKVDTARVISPTGRAVDIPVGDGYVGMVDREHFDEWLRERAVSAGAERITGTFERTSRDGGRLQVVYRQGSSRRGSLSSVRARVLMGADGALSQVARQELPEEAAQGRSVFAYHEIIESPTELGESWAGQRCDVHYDGVLSPDFYAWVFPHGETTSVGTGSARKGFALREAVAALREREGLDRADTVRCEGAPIPLKPLPRWDNGQDVIVAGDAAGVVAPSSGEGIFYAMTSGRFAATAAIETLRKDDPRQLGRARKRFLREHGRVFQILSMMQWFWYRSDRRREGFVAICADRDVQHLTFQGYMNKKLVRGNPLTHARIAMKNLGHLSGVIRA